MLHIWNVMSSSIPAKICKGTVHRSSGSLQTLAYQIMHSVLRSMIPVLERNLNLP